MMKKIVITEFIGTFLLVLFACGLVVVDQMFAGAITHLGISLGTGLIVLILIYAIGNISGAHLNPAVTFAFFIAKDDFAIKEVFAYIAAQVTGGIAAAAFLKAILNHSITASVHNPSVNIPSAIILEILFSFILMYVILNISTGHMEKGIMAGVAVGFTVAILILMGGFLTGGSMNPARSFAPALISGDLNNVWIYITAPFIGTSLAVPIVKFTQIHKED